MAIVGGGFQGLATAIALRKAQPDLRVAVLEHEVGLCHPPRYYSGSKMQELSFLGQTRNLAEGYTCGGQSPRRNNLFNLPIQGCPAGSSASTAGDLLAFHDALTQGLLLGPAWTRWFFTGEVPERAAD